MAYQDGFTYIQGPFEIRYSNTSSTATFRANNPVTFGLGRALVEATSATSEIVGIAQADAANSIGGPLAGKCPYVPLLPGQVWATKVQTGVAGSATSAGQVYNLEKSGNHLRLDTDSAGSGRVAIVERGYGQSPVDSADSSVYVTFLQDFAGPFASVQSSVFEA